MFADVVETYGRTLDIETIEASGGPADATAAQADAQKVIDMGRSPPSADPGRRRRGGRRSSTPRSCASCGAPPSRRHVNADDAPYLWPTGPTPEQADAHLFELVGKQLVGKPAEFAGDPALQSQERVFGWVQAETETGEYTARNDAFDAAAGGVSTAARSRPGRRTSSTPPTRPEIATTAIARMKEASVTTIILSTDFLIPADITDEATKQNYFPEWVVGPSVLDGHDDLRSHVRSATVVAHDRPLVADRTRRT